MDPNLHVKQGVNLLERVLNYAPMVREDGEATVALTPEDWHVVADLLFQMDVEEDVLPEAIEEYTLTSENRVIELSTPEGPVRIEQS